MQTQSLNQVLSRIGLFFLCAVFPVLAFSQKTARPGMVASELNYTTFTTVGGNPERDLPYNAPCQACEEDISARTAYTRSFKGKGDKADLVYSQSGYAAINIKNANGNWVPVDARLKPESNGRFSALSQHAPTAIDMASGYSSVKNVYGEMAFNQRPELLWRADNGDVQSLGKANFSRYTAGNDGVYVTDVWPGIDMEMRAIVGGIKTNFIVKTRPQQTGGHLLIRDEYRLNNGMRLKRDGDGFMAETAGGQEAFVVSACIGYDNQGQRANGVQSFAYGLDGNVVDMEIPLSVLQNPNMVYPYTIDPMVTSTNTLPQASITGSGYSTTCITNSCNYNMTVPSPANATIVDIQMSFMYIATGSCWLYDGNLRFASGACLTGDYWCNTIGPGTCTGTNVSLFAELGACMPPPSCTPQNVPFQLQFFRCYQSGGCSNTCIGAGAPWVMTLVGQTVAVASATVNGSGSTTICQGASANLNGVGQYGVPPYNYSWSPGGATGSSISVSPGSTTTYTLTVTDACSQVSTANVTVNVNPSPATPAITSNSPVCTGQAINLGTTAGGAYVWTGPNGFTSTVQNPSIPSATAANSGTYSLNIVSGGCTSAVATHTVVVNPAPAAPVLGGNAPLCEGSALNLTATGGAGSYSWTGPNGYTSSAQNPTINPATVANSGNYTAVYIASGCTSAVATYNAVVNPTPATPTAGSNSPICVGSSINLTSPASTGTYVWTGPNGYSSGVQNPTIPAATTSHSGTYSLYLVENGCTSGVSNVTVNVINPPPTPAFTTNSPVCEGSTITLTGTPLPIVNYVWAGPNGYTGTGQTVNIGPATAANGGTYSLVLTASGCTSAAAVQTVVVNPAPAPPLVGGNSPICAGSTLNLTATHVGSGSYAWTGPNSYSGTTQNPSIPSATTAHAGTYSAVYIENGCTSAVATYNVVVNPTPATPVASSNSPVCVGSTINLSTATSTSGSYAWSGPSGFASTVQNPSIPSATSAEGGTYTLAIIENGCTSAVASTTVNVVNPPITPSFSTNSPVCEGGTLTLTGTFYPIVNYVWSGPNGFTGTGQTVTINPATAAEAGSYSLVLTASGCTSTATVHTVVVNPTPAAPAVGGNSPVCAGATLNLTATGSGPGTYSWSGPNAFISTAQNPSISPIAAAGAGTYSAVYIENGCTSAVATYPVTVNAVPATPAVTSNSPVCQGTTITLFTPTVAGALYNWTGPNAFSSSTQNPTIPTATATQAGIYSVTVTANGCASLPGSTTVVVAPPPATPVITSNSPVCENGLLQLGTAATTGSYHWNGPTAWTSNSQNPVLSGFGTAQAGSYSLYIIENGCTSSTASVNVQVAPAPQVSYTGPSQVCGNDATLTATAVVTPPAGISNVIWYAPGQIGTGTSINHTFAQTAPNTVTGFVVAQSSNNCLDSAAFSLQLVDVPVADFTVEDLCDGQSLQFHENHSWEGNETAAPTYSWEYMGSSFSSATDPTYTFGGPGTYTVTLAGGNPASAACGDTVSKTVHVYPVPVLDFTYVAECVQDVQFTGSANPDSLVTAYSWDFTDGGTDTGTVATHAFAQAGVYQVEFTAVSANNCTTSVVKAVQIDNASTQLPEIPNIITPNGDNVNDVIDLDNVIGTCGEYEFLIFSRWGGVVYTQKLGGAPFTGKSSLGTWLTPGVYFYTLILNESKKSGSITVIR